MNVVVLRRRLFYISAIVAILVPLYFLGRPSIRNADGSVKQPGGTLSQIRTQYNLGQGDLGEIDPASESMRLATLGLRGVASTILWQKAEFYKKEKYWDRLAATLNQIAVLQPHFVKVWEFQSHNLSYNVSSEFDNYRHRYLWVKRGIDYLIKGAKYNKQRTEMPYETGWFYGNKFGVSDEKKQFRELYRDDDNYHAELLTKTGIDVTGQDGLGPDRKPDNWLSGRLWYGKAYEMAEAGARPAKSTMMFYRMGPQWLVKYCEGIQADGVLDQAARYAWEAAGRDWRRFGERPILTTFGDTIYLTELEKANREYRSQKAAFEEFMGETFTKMVDDRKTELTPEELAAYEKDYLDRTFEEVLLAEQATSRLTIQPMEIADAAPEDQRVEALQRAKDLTMIREKINHIEIYRNQINYSYWEQRCVAEQEDAALAARTSMYEANELLEKGQLDAALEMYETAWINWNLLFNKHPAMMIDDAADDVLASIERYRKLRDDPLLPEDFELKKFMQFRQVFEEQLADPAMMGVISDWPAKYPGRNFLDEMLQKTEATIQPLDPEADATDAEDANSGETTEDPAATTPPADAPPENPTAEESAVSSVVNPPDAGAPPMPAEEAPAKQEPKEKAEVEEKTPIATGSNATVAKPDEGSPPSPDGN